MPRLLATLLLVLAALVSHARAHDPFYAEIKAEADASTLTVRLTFARSVAAHLAGLSAGPRHHYDPERFPAESSAFTTAASTLLFLEKDGARISPGTPAEAALIEDGADVVFTLRYPRPAGPGPLRLGNPWLDRLPPAENYVAAFTLHEGPARLAGPLLVSSKTPMIEFPLPASPLGSATPSATPPTPPRASAGDFFKLGVEHILTGYDHLLYLAALILGCAGLRTIVAIVTSFTVSHSITLALATLGVVTPPSDLVEQIIAASIVLVALDNLRLRGQVPKRRWLVAFAFGLVHGFGFAGLLAELGLGSDDHAVVVPLLAFNLGVEAGQLLLVAIVLPLLLRARRHPPFFTIMQPAASAAVAVFGLIWFVGRI